MFVRAAALEEPLLLRRLAAECALQLLGDLTDSLLPDWPSNFSRFQHLRPGQSALRISVRTIPEEPQGKVAVMAEHAIARRKSMLHEISIESAPRSSLFSMLVAAAFNVINTQEL